MLLLLCCFCKVRCNLPNATTYLQCICCYCFSRLTIFTRLCFFHVSLSSFNNLPLGKHSLVFLPRFTMNLWLALCRRRVAALVSSHFCCLLAAVVVLGLYRGRCFCCLFYHPLKQYQAILARPYDLTRGATRL